MNSAMPAAETAVSDPFELLSPGSRLLADLQIIARRYADPILDAEDLLSEGCAAVVRLASRHQSLADVSLRPFVAKVARNAMFKAKRRFHRQRIRVRRRMVGGSSFESAQAAAALEVRQALALPLETNQDYYSSCAHELERAELCASVRRAVAKLPAKQARVLVGRFFEEKSCAEVATELGVSASAVGVLQGRALDRLKRSLETDPNFRVDGSGVTAARNNN